MAVECRRIDAPAQSATTLELILFRADEYFDAAFRYCGEEQVASRRPDLLLCNASESRWLTGQLVDLLEKWMQANTRIRVGRRHCKIFLRRGHMNVHSPDRTVLVIVENVLQKCWKFDLPSDKHILVGFQYGFLCF